MSGITLTLPAGRGAAWSGQVVERFVLSLRLLCRALEAPEPAFTVTEQGEEVALATDGVRLPLPPGLAAEAVARRLDDRIGLIAWPAILAPALAARGVGETWWLRHAALRGLTVGDLAALAAGGADDETIAWRLADRFPPVLSLRAGERTAAAFGDASLRDGAAQQAASWCGLPVPKLPAPLRDAALGPDEAALALGALTLPAFAIGDWDDPRASLATALQQAAPALVDPALALALVTDEARVSRRHAAAALARTGAITIARRIAEAATDMFGMVDLAAIVDEAAGIAPP
ncbi:MAG: hypothetical protein MUC89_03250 [Acetobacteraceae bacterium]|nr:hypothetical protein [Acetobacteraceae bacterium]